MDSQEETMDNLNSAEWTKRRDAVFFLSQLEEGASHLPVFIKMLEDAHWEVRVEAAHAIGKYPDPESQFPLIERLADEHQTVRRVAAKVLGDVGDHRAVEALKKALDDENAYVRKNSAKSLLNIWEREK